MTIDPRIGFYLGIITGILIFSSTGAGGTELISILGASVGNTVVGLCGYLAGVLALVTGALHAIPSGSSQADLQKFYLRPEAAPPASPGPAVKAIILLAVLVLGALAFATPSFAQTRLHVTGKPVEDIKADINDANRSAASSALGNTAISNALAKPFQDLATFLSSDAAGAIALSTQIPNLQDGHGQQCWMAMSTAGEVFKAHPVPVTLKVMTDVEALRLLAMTANNLCANVHCTQVFADLTSMAQAASPVPLPIPGLHDLCSKIPQIAQVPAATQPAAVTPTPAAAPAPQ